MGPYQQLGSRLAFFRDFGYAFRFKKGVVGDEWENCTQLVK